MNPGHDISFDVADLRFRYRIAGIILDKGRVLLQQVKGQDYWFMPGGRCALGESACECLKREIAEELNTGAQVGRLVWVVEGFFKMDSRNHHELCLLFLVNLPAGSPLLAAAEIDGTDIGDGNFVEVVNKWHRLDKLDEITLVPPFLKAGLRNIPGVTEHIVQRDR
jgi:8-oxo-dGTP pyrophosphatase MutT (NUDIX family)